MPVDCQLSKVSLNLAFSHISIMTVDMEEDKAPDPTDILVLGVS